MSERIQTALVKQLNRQLRIAENKENQRLHRELRHRVRKLRLIDEHFDEQRDQITMAFEQYRDQIAESIAINKLRFELCVDHKLESIMDVDYVINHAEVYGDTNEMAARMCYERNSFLFFGSLYPTRNTNTRNDDFYWFIAAVIVCGFLY